jgi:hypothetical protein
MPSTSETGHAKNVANLDVLISFVTAYGKDYNPSKASISVKALQELSARAKSTITTLNEARAAYGNAAAAREVAFKPLNRFISRVLNALRATDTTVQVDENAKSIVRKIQGVRAKAKKTEEEKTALAALGKETKEISSAQTSYDSRLENFDKLIKLLKSISLYKPNEEDLKIASLILFYRDLNARNTEVIAATTQISNARISRNEILYKNNTCLVDLALDTKTYIKSLYGATSPQYRQISKLQFKIIKA